MSDSRALQRLAVALSLSLPLLALTLPGATLAQARERAGRGAPQDEQAVPGGGSAEAAAKSEGEPKAGGQDGEAEAAAASQGEAAALPGEAEVELTADQRAKRGEALLERALAAASEADWRNASHHAYEAWAVFPASAERREAAQLTLADSLLQLGFEQAAASHYFDIVQHRSVLQLLPRALAGIEELSRRGLILEEDLLRGALAEAELANLPPELADFLHYNRGLANLRLGNRRWIQYEFGRIRADALYAQRAQLVQAIAKVRDNEVDRALEMIEELLEGELDDGVEQEALLVRARLLFELGRMDEALATFRQVRSTRSVPAGEVLLERAWSFYRQGRLHDAMGMIYALGAPAHVDLFLPEAYILRGLIYQRFCHFRAARTASADFRKRYGEAIAAVEEGVDPASIEDIAYATSIVPQVAAVLKVSDATRRERRLLGAQGAWMEQGGLRSHLDDLYELVGARMERARERAVGRGAAEISERLLAAREQANLLEYEVGVSIHKRVHDAEGRVYRRPETQRVPRTGEKTFYEFNGEYWSDELGDMRFLIENRCVE